MVFRQPTGISRFRIGKVFKHGNFFPASLLLLELGNLLSRRFNVNEFSTNHFYKNRLVRCYLGASHGSQVASPHPCTGFDPQDDIPLRKLERCAPQHDAPYAIINCALNLNHGSELAWQERKAASFIFTPRIPRLHARAPTRQRVRVH